MSEDAGFRSTEDEGQSGLDPRRACAWPRRLKQGPVRLIEPSEFDRWITSDDEHIIVINKPGDVVCHPSKAGPWSSLVGAVREHCKVEASHLIFRLDRETSGVVVFARTPRMASRLQKATQERRVRKSYLAILRGEMPGPLSVDQPLGDDPHSPVFVKSAVVPDGQRAVTHYTPLSVAGGFTLARVVTETGRKHQIRAHAQWAGYPMIGDKIYGGDDRCFLHFLDHGWTPELEAKLLLPRQALHCESIDLTLAGLERVLTAPMAEDMRAFCKAHGLASEGL